jgi:hypothetical protein
LDFYEKLNETMCHDLYTPKAEPERYSSIKEFAECNIRQEKQWASPNIGFIIANLKRKAVVVHSVFDCDSGSADYTDSHRNSTRTLLATRHADLNYLILEAIYIAWDRTGPSSHFEGLVNCKRWALSVEPSNSFWEDMRNNYCPHLPPWEDVSKQFKDITILYRLSREEDKLKDFIKIMFTQDVTDAEIRAGRLKSGGPIDEIFANKAEYERYETIKREKSKEKAINAMVIDSDAGISLCAQFLDNEQDTTDKQSKNEQENMHDTKKEQKAAQAVVQNLLDKYKDRKCSLEPSLHEQVQVTEKEET